MRHYYSADAIREAEAPLLASLPDGALMRRAAYGLATAIIGELIARTGGVAGRRVCAVVGSGDNGGDALWAATFLCRRGAAADAILLKPERTHRRRWRRSGRRVGAIVERSLRQPISSLTVSWVSLVRGRCGRTRPKSSKLSKRGLPGRRRRHPQWRRRGDRCDYRSGRARRADRHLRRPETGTCAGRLRPRRLVDIGLDLPDTDVLGFDAADVAARWPIPGPHDDKYTQGVTGVMAGSSTYPGAAVLCTGAAVAATSGMVRYAGSAHSEVLAHWPK